MSSKFFYVATILLLVLSTAKGFTQTNDSAKRPSIVIVPKLEKPRKANRSAPTAASLTEACSFCLEIKSRKHRKNWRYSAALAHS